MGDDAIHSQATWYDTNDVELEDAVDAVKDARIVIMNPPFTERVRMGEKFPKDVQAALRQRVDALENLLVEKDPELEKFVTRRAGGPLFVSLAEQCLNQESGILAMINPTIMFSSSSGLQERRVLAQRFYIHTVLTCHQPGNFNMSQNTNINESIAVMRRHTGPKPPTRFINLDRMPVDDGEAADFHRCLLDCQEGQIANGWGEVSHWPAEIVEAGDWTPAIWRSPELAKAAGYFSSHQNLRIMEQIGLSPADTGPSLRVNCKSGEAGTPGTFPIIKSRGANGQLRIDSQPDDWLMPKKRDAVIPKVDQILEKAGYLLVTSGQDNSTARLIAVASGDKYVGNGWMPVKGVTPEVAKAAAVSLNSTIGRLQMMRNTRRKLTFPAYSVESIANIRIPNIKDARIRSILADCWERTKDMTVPQFRDGECEVRRLWDEAVADAMGWDAAELSRLRHLLHKEPHVRGLGYNQYADEVEVEPADRERFRELAERWEKETFFMSNSKHMIEHPAHQEIVRMGEPAIPLILERMQSHGGHWFYALYQITGVNPIAPEDRGNIPAMEASWIEWGNRNGFA